VRTSTAYDDDDDDGNDKTYSPSDEGSSDEQEDEDEMVRSSFDFAACDEEPLKKKKRAPSVRRPWSQEERAVLFAACKGLKCPPSSNVIRRLQQLCPSLQKRQISGIKSRAQHFINSGC